MVRHSAAGAAAFALAIATTATAQEYAFRIYGSAEGLRNPVVLSLAQDRAGYIWAGTEGGLFRYDGTRFRLMGEAEGLPCSAEVHGLFAAVDGALWANTCSQVFRFDGHRFLAVEGIHGLLRGAQVMADGAGGSVLITTQTGIYEASRGPDGSFRARSHPLPLPLAGKRMHGIVRQGDRLWFGCDQQLCLEQGGQVSLFGSQQGLPQDAWDAIQIAPDGTVWARSPKSVYRREPGHPDFSKEHADIRSSGFWGAVTLTRDGSVLVPTDGGLAIRDKTGWSLVNRQRGLPNDNAVAALEDREGSVWIGLAGGGLARWLGRGVWESWKMEQRLPSNIVWNIRRDRRGALWIATSSGLARINNSGQVRTWTKKDGLGGENVRWLGESSDGSIWAAMKPGGLARINPVSGKVRRTGPGDGLTCDPEDVFVDRHGRLWLPTLCGLFLNGQPSVSNRVTEVITPAAFGRSAWKVLEDEQGTIWVSNGKALWSLREGQWRQHGRAQGLLTDNPYVMALGGDGSIWLRHRYDAGVDRLEVSGGRIVSAAAVVPADPRGATGTAFHGFDVFSNFWRGTTDGVAVLHGDKWTKFTTEDGLVSNDCNGEAFWADADGGVWLGTSGGLAHYLPGTGVPAEPVADPSIVRLEIVERARLIRAEFSTLNYKAEQLAQFAYRLDSGPWIDSLARNISTNGLGPGPHRLEVRSRVRDGPLSPQIAAADFRMARRWNETWWARVLALAGVLMAIALFVRWRLSEAVRRQAKLEALVELRTASLRTANRQLDAITRELQTSEDRLKAAERLAHMGHWDWDVKTNEFSWSEEVFRIFGVPREYAPTYDRFVQAAVPHDSERLKQWTCECLARRTGQTIEFQIVRPDGDSRILSCTSEVSVDEEGMPVRFFGACQDITDSRRVQQEDFARKKLESVGLLAGGIAHDFNNLLGGVLAQAELALEESVPGVYPYEALTTIRNVAIRGSEIVRQLMIYAGKESQAPALVDVSRVVFETFELLKLSVSKGVTFVTDLDSKSPPVWASPAEIRQIVMNLVTNASDAIGNRHGVIRVTTHHVDRDDAQTTGKGLEDNHHMLLEVSDTGSGMPREMQTRVFDPFFSTRGAGHGLGLAVVHGIVRSLNGVIDFVSEPGHGTTFQIWLPCAENTADATGDHTAGEPSVRSSQFVVLVVEDEAPLRQAVIGMLRRAGFSVLGAADGTSAIELLRANSGKIDVILLDMTIPGASSNDVLAEAAQTRPGIRVILTSAYSKEMLMPLLSASQIHGFIRKPYRLLDVVQTLKKAASA